MFQAVKNYILWSSHNPTDYAVKFAKIWASQATESVIYFNLMILKQLFIFPFAV